MTKSAMGRDVHSTISYLANSPLWQREKPYIADFPLDNIEGAMHTNQIIHKHPTTISDVRGITGRDFTLDKNGFCFKDGKTSLTAEDALANPKACEEKYFSEIEALMKDWFPEYSRVDCFDLTVRKRESTFPWDNEIKLIKHEQPAAVAHSDYSLEGALMELGAAFPGQECFFEGHEFDVLNVWRPLVGPNDDWPLAFCDGQTINRSKDGCISDVVHFNRVGENILLHQNDAHRWYYMSAQDVDEFAVFRNCDSSNSRPQTFHAAFDNPKTMSGPRVSAEVRVVAFY